MLQVITRHLSAALYSQVTDHIDILSVSFINNHHGTHENMLEIEYDDAGHGTNVQIYKF